MEAKTEIDELLEHKSAEAVDKICTASADAEKENYQSALESFELHKERQRQQIEQRLKELQEEYYTAYEVCFEQLIGDSSSRPPLSRNEKETILFEIKRGQKNLLDAIQSNHLEAALNEGKTFQQILEYSDNTLEKFYFVGIECIDKKDFKKAKDVFTLLVLINPQYPNFWVSIAVCQRELEDWNAALQACMTAQAIDVANPLPYLYASECYAKLKDHSHAIEQAEKALEHINQNNDSGFAEIKNAALEWKEKLLKIA